jgi:chromosome segregation ATPase
MRAQLERHRSEVEELEKEINEAKDEVVEANQLANTFEKGECKCIL